MAEGLARGALGRSLLLAGALSVPLVTPARAEIAISAAKITGGELWVLGSTGETDAEISLDGQFTGRTDGRGNFEFRVIYHPASCIVTLRVRQQEQRAVVGECGQQGPPGPAPAASTVAGPPGPADRKSVV